MLAKWKQPLEAKQAILNLCLKRTKVPLKMGVEQWLAALLKSIQESLYSNIVDCIQEIESSQSVEEWAVKVNTSKSIFTSC